MIVVTRLNGPQFGINPDLVERVEETPDTVMTLVDGRKFIISEPVQVVIDRIVEFRGRVVANAQRIAEDPQPALAVVSDGGVAPAVPLRPEGGDDGSR